MVFRYWKEEGKTLVIKDVDRLVYDSPRKLQIRSFVSGRYDWVNLEFGIDYLQFILATE